MAGFIAAICTMNETIGMRSFATLVAPVISHATATASVGTSTFRAYFTYVDKTVMTSLLSATPAKYSLCFIASLAGIRSALQQRPRQQRSVTTQRSVGLARRYGGEFGLFGWLTGHCRTLCFCWSVALIASRHATKLHPEQRNALAHPSHSETPVTQQRRERK